MAKLSISVPDDLEQRFEAFSKKEGKTMSASIAEAMEARLAQSNGSASPQNAPAGSSGSGSAPVPDTSQQAPLPQSKSAPQTPVPPSSSAPANQDFEYVMGRLQELGTQNQSLLQNMAEHAAVIFDMNKRIGELDMRQSKLWHDVHEK